LFFFWQNVMCFKNCHRLLQRNVTSS
jgi:hypothetical protein